MAKVEGINHICVVGAGNMGHQIALSAALAGYKVICTDVNKEILAKAEQFVPAYLEERVAKGKLTAQIVEETKKNISFTDNLGEAAQATDLVIEAIVEKLELKHKLFVQLDEICQPETILATNSSYIVSSKIAPVTKRPEKVCNMHFFNPALVMKLVEVVKGPHTSDETIETIMAVAQSLGKTPVLLKKEIYGFLVNRILTAIKNEALFLNDIDVASPEEIDLAVTLALGHPMGPFRLMDLTGIDLTYHVSMERYKETMDPAYKPSPSVVEKFSKGEWGRKTGIGWYDYRDK